MTRNNFELSLTGVDGPTGKSVLLYSGGMDSIMIQHILKPDILLYIPNGTIYQKQEDKVIKQQRKTMNIIELRDVLNLGFMEREDAIVPDRNAYFIMLASNFGETIYLGGIEGDTGPDNDNEFCSRMENLLNYTHQEQHWTKEKKFNISAPFRSKTKTELLRLYLSKDGDSNILQESFSCYKSLDKQCGECKSCVRKAVALKNNNIFDPDKFINNPFESSFFKKIVEENNKKILLTNESFEFAAAKEKQ